MKFKIAVIGLLTAILAVCCFTSYRLLQEAEKQTAIQAINAKINVIIGEGISEELKNDEIYSSQLFNAHRDLHEIAGSIAVIDGGTP